MVRLITKALSKFSVWSIKQVLTVIWFALPHLLEMAIFCLGVVAQFTFITAVSVVQGVPSAATKISRHWKKQTVASGLFPYTWEDYLDTPYYWLAVVMIYLGWIMTFFIFVFILDLVINLMF